MEYRDPVGFECGGYSESAPHAAAQRRFSLTGKSHGDVWHGKNMVETWILAGRGGIDRERVGGKLACYRLDDESGIIAEAGEILHGAFAVVSYDHCNQKVKKSSLPEDAVLPELTCYAKLILLADATKLPLTALIGELIFNRVRVEYLCVGHGDDVYSRFSGS